MLVSIFLAVNRLLEWLGKSHLDWLVARATEQMAPKDGLSPAEAPNPKHDAEILEISDDEKALLDELVDNPEIYRRVVALIDGRRRESLLTDWFERAASDFQNEEFSQEAFRTFSEVHKSARESVETTNEKLRREIIEVYVSALLKIRDAPIRRLLADNYANDILDQALRVLSISAAFSRDSFRTLTDAYNLAMNR